MKVVLFCGGFGMRMREYSEALPKPMVAIGYRPILWHVMKYYAYYGHKDFILCLGYKADVIKKYFLEYNECVSNDFILSRGGKNLELLSSDIEDWNITDDEDATIVPSVESVLALDLRFARTVIKTWLNAMLGEDEELGKGSTSGQLSAPPNFPMEAL